MFKDIHNDSNLLVQVTENCFNSITSGSVKRLYFFANADPVVFRIYRKNTNVASAGLSFSFGGQIVLRTSFVLGDYAYYDMSGVFQQYINKNKPTAFTPTAVRLDFNLIVTYQISGQSNFSQRYLSELYPGVKWRFAPCYSELDGMGFLGYAPKTLYISNNFPTYIVTKRQNNLIPYQVMLSAGAATSSYNCIQPQNNGAMVLTWFSTIWGGWKSVCLAPETEQINSEVQSVLMNTDKGSFLQGGIALRFKIICPTIADTFYYSDILQSEKITLRYDVDNSEEFAGKVQPQNYTLNFNKPQDISFIVEVDSFRN